MTTYEDYDFSGSMGAESAEEEAKKSGGNWGRRLEFLALDGSEQGKAKGTDKIHLRLLNDVSRNRLDEPLSRFDMPWINALQHYAPTRPKPDFVGKDGYWPEKTYGGCRKDKVFSKRFNGECIVCEQTKNRPSARTFCLAVEREEVHDENGKRLGFRDAVREVPIRGEDGKFIKKEGTEKEYETEIVPAFVVISQGWKNFFGPLKAMANYYGGTVMDAEWLVIREGTDTDTSYQFIHVATSPTIEAVGSLNAGDVLDFRAPGVLEGLYGDYLPDLRQIVADKVSDDVVARYWQPGWVPEGYEKGKGESSEKSDNRGYQPQGPAPSTPTAPAASAGGGNPTSASSDALRNRILGKTS